MLLSLLLDILHVMSIVDAHAGQLELHQTLIVDVLSPAENLANQQALVQAHVGILFARNDKAIVELGAFGLGRHSTMKLA